MYTIPLSSPILNYVFPSFGNSNNYHTSLLKPKQKYVSQNGVAPRQEIFKTFWCGQSLLAFFIFQTYLNQLFIHLLEK